MKLALPLVLIAGLCLGCEHKAVDDGSKSHDFPPQHGGQRFDLETHGPNIEVKADETAGTIQLWLYDAHNSKLGIKTAPILKVPAGPKKITGTGAADAWTFEDDLLKTHHHDLSFTIKVGEKEYNHAYHPPH